MQRESTDGSGNGDILSLSAAQLETRYRDRTLSPSAVVDAVLVAADRSQGLLNPFAAIDAEGALQAAALSEVRWRSGRPASRLDGVPITVKDQLAVRGLPRWDGTAMATGEISQEDSIPVQRARTAGAIVIGTTTMPDLGASSSGISSQFGVTRNPWNPAWNSGGSSAGSAVAVAAGIGPLSIGSDGGGSVRIPAALCGVVGIKPTQGRVAMTPSTTDSTVGPIARTVEDASALLEVIGCHHRADLLALAGRYEPIEPRADLGGVKIGVLSEMGYGVPPEQSVLEALHAAAELVGGLGARVQVIEDVQVNREDADAFLLRASVRNLLSIRAAAPERRHLVNPTIRENAEHGATATAVGYQAAIDRITAVREHLAEQLNGFDYVLMPTLPRTHWQAEAFAPPEATSSFDHLQYTMWLNVMGVPAATVCTSLSPAGAPIAVQVVGRRFDDSGVLDVARILEAARTFELRFPVGG